MKLTAVTLVKRAVCVKNTSRIIESNMLSESVTHPINYSGKLTDNLILFATILLIYASMLLKKTFSGY